MVQIICAMNSSPPQLQASLVSVRKREVGKAVPWMSLVPIIATVWKLVEMARVISSDSIVHLINKKLQSNTSIVLRYLQHTKMFIYLVQHILAPYLFNLLGSSAVVCCLFVVHKCISVFKTVHYLFTYLTTLFYAHLMSEALSKREQRKLQHMLKLFEASEVPQAKPKKKRKHNERGITLLANQHNEEQENYAETKELSQFNSTPYRDTAEHKQEGFLNHKYFPEHEHTLLNYLNEYHYREIEKSYQKQCQDYEALDQKGTSLAVTPSPTAILEKIRPILREFHSSSDRRPCFKSRLWACGA